jgi:hypothetical protein
MLGVFAEFERAMTQERVRAGLARARADGKIVGRPKIAEKTERAVRSALSKKDRPGPYSAGNALFRLCAGKPPQKMIVEPMLAGRLQLTDNLCIRLH